MSDPSDPKDAAVRELVRAAERALDMLRHLMTQRLIMNLRVDAETAVYDALAQAINKLKEYVP